MKGGIFITPPIVCFVTYNRAGLNARNLTALLNTTDDFELYIIDNHSQDDTWRFIEGLQDDRIKCKKRFALNRHVVYAINYVLSKRKKDQYFILVESDIRIQTKDWVTRFLKAMEAFPNVGVMSACYWVAKKLRRPPQIVRNGDDTYYRHQIVYLCCACMRPALFDCIGYFNEEVLWGDGDIWNRVNEFTHFKMGYIDTIQASHEQSIPCSECLLKEQCSVLENSETCFDIRRRKRNHLNFVKLKKEKGSHRKFCNELRSGKRSVYCASIYDPDSIKHHYYNKEWAEEHLKLFIDLAN
ncbi:MAG: glycosyltransferase family 2 protein [Firmicutes bacterium]|nr:glycosyltransferase family 2 protein [Bacillota bacterium]